MKQQSLLDPEPQHAPTRAEKPQETPKPPEPYPPVTESTASQTPPPSWSESLLLYFSGREQF